MRILSNMRLGFRQGGVPSELAGKWGAAATWWGSGIDGYVTRHNGPQRANAGLKAKRLDRHFRKFEVERD
jgi:hypothetical protein